MRFLNLFVFIGKQINIFILTKTSKKLKYDDPYPYFL